jgi:hypothetical protein
MALGATLAGVLVAILGPQEDRETLRAFYLRVRPPGFWGPITQGCGVDPAEAPRRLARGLAATAAAAWSVFALLVGVGTALVGSPAPAWAPSRGLWIVGLVVSSLAMVPVWTRLGATERD